MATKKTGAAPDPRLGRVSGEDAPPAPEIPAWLDRVRSRLSLNPVDPSPLRNVFLERAFEAVIEISRNMSSQALEETAAQKSDYLVLFRALRHPELLPEIEKLEPLASPYLKGMEEQQNLLRMAGGLMTAEEVANMLRVTRQAVDKQRKGQKLIAIPQGQRGFGYPACQFAATGPIPGLEQLLQVLTPDGWSQLNFLLTPNSALKDRTPLEVLKRGNVASVLKAAEQFGEHGAL